MKPIITIFITTLISFSTFAQKAYDHFQIQVDGLGCPFCAYGLEKKFKEFKGLKKISIDIETGNFEFDYPNEKKLTMESVILQVQKAGYTPKTAKIIRQNGEIESHIVSRNTETIKDHKVKKSSLIVSGNCEMCKARIETAVLAINGINQATWNISSKKLEYTNTIHITQKSVAKKIANAGHDNELLNANKEAYNNLPPCCTYKK